MVACISLTSKTFFCVFRVKIVASCDMKLENFPMDTQKCMLIFGSCKYYLHHRINFRYPLAPFMYFSRFLIFFPLLDERWLPNPSKVVAFAIGISKCSRIPMNAIFFSSSREMNQLGRSACKRERSMGYWLETRLLGQYTIPSLRILLLPSSKFGQRQLVIKSKRGDLSQLGMANNFR